MNRTLSFLPIVLLSSIVSGCITAPYHETVYSSGNTDRVVTFSGYLDEPGEAVSLQAFVDGRWEEFATAESAALAVARFLRSEGITAAEADAWSSARRSCKPLFRIM